MDELVVGDGSGAAFVNTTSHPDETIEEVIQFAKNWRCDNPAVEVIGARVIVDADLVAKYRVGKRLVGMQGTVIAISDDTVRVQFDAEYYDQYRRELYHSDNFHGDRFEQGPLDLRQCVASRIFVLLEVAPARKPSPMHNQIVDAEQETLDWYDEIRAATGV